MDFKDVYNMCKETERTIITTCLNFDNVRPENNTGT